MTKYVTCEVQIRMFGLAPGNGVLIGGASSLFSPMKEDVPEEERDYNFLVKDLMVRARQQLDAALESHPGSHEMTVTEAMAYVNKEAKDNADDPTMEDHQVVYDASKEGIN